MAVLPAEIPVGLVTGQFYFVNEDNVDADTDPELTVVSGSVTFKCSAKRLRMPSKKATVVPLEFQAVFNSQGQLVSAGDPTKGGVELPATDSALFNPTNFTWTVTFDLVQVENRHTLDIEPFTFQVPQGVETDLTLVMPVDSSPGTITIQGPQGIQGIQGIPGPVGTGVPAGGSALQYVRKNAGNTATEWVTGLLTTTLANNSKLDTDAPSTYPLGNSIMSTTSNGFGINFGTVITHRTGVTSRTLQTVTQSTGGLQFYRTETSGDVWTAWYKVATDATATNALAGLMSAADKTKLDGATSANTPSALVQRNSGGDISVRRALVTDQPTSIDHATRKDYVDTAVGAKISATEKGAASGVAPLGTDSRVPDANLPQRLQDADITNKINTAVPPAVSSYIANDPSVVNSAATAAQNTQGIILPVKASTSYTAGARAISPAGDFVSAKVAFTTGVGGYVAADWNISGQETRLVAVETRTTTQALTGDLDTYLTPGVYGQNASGNATTAFHYPRAIRGSLKVVSVAGTGTVQQTYTTGGSQRQVFVREYYSGVWSEWTEIGIVTKIVGTALTLSGGPENNLTTTTDYGGRLLLDYGVTIPKWRIHMRNHNLRDNVAYTGALNLTGFNVGVAETIDGLPTGRWLGGTSVNLQGAATTPADGSEWVSNWFTYQLDSHKQYMLSYGITTAAGQVLHRGFGAVWTVSGGSTTTATNSYGSRSTLAPLDIWIEVEVPATTKVLGVIGDSLSCGHSSTSPVHDSWLAAYCRTHQALPVFWAASGDRLEWFADINAPKATRYANMAKPDTLYFAMGSNDISDGQTLAVVQDRMKATMVLMRQIATENVILTAIRPPEPLEPSAEASVRVAYTDWLETTLPGHATMFNDTGAKIKAADGTLDARWRASPTNVHLSTAGYARMAQAL